MNIQVSNRKDRKKKGKPGWEQERRYAKEDKDVGIEGLGILKVENAGSPTSLTGDLGNAQPLTSEHLVQRGIFTFSESLITGRKHIHC